MIPFTHYYHNFPYFPLPPPPPHNIPSPPQVLPPPPNHPFLPPPPHITPNPPPHNPTLPPPSPPAPKPPTPPSSPHQPITPPRPPPSPKPPTPPSPPHHPITPPRPFPVPATPPPDHPFHPPSPPNHPIFPPPPPIPAPGHRSTVIVVVFVSLGGLFFLAFLSVALFCFIKKRKKKSHEKTEIIEFDEHMKVEEEIVPGPHGEKMKVLTIEEDVHMVEKTEKNEKLNKDSASHDPYMHMEASYSENRHLHDKV